MGYRYTAKAYHPAGGKGKERDDDEREREKGAFKRYCADALLF